MVRGCPFLVQVTVVAGEPVEVQVRVEDKLEVCEVNVTILGGAGGKILHIAMQVRLQKGHSPIDQY